MNYKNYHPDLIDSVRQLAYSIHEAHLKERLEEPPPLNHLEQAVYDIWSTPLFDSWREAGEYSLPKKPKEEAEEDVSLIYMQSSLRCLEERGLVTFNQDGSKVKLTELGRLIGEADVIN